MWPHTRPTVCRAPTYGYPYGYAWATLWVRHVISLRALLQNITRLHPSFQLVLSRGIRGERHGQNDSTERNITTLDMSQSDKQKGKSFHGLGEAKHFNAKREKRTFCARLLHPQTRLMHPDRTHPSTVIQAYSSNTLKSPSLRTQLASPPYNDKCGARTPDQLSTKKPPLPRLEPMNTLSASCHCHPLSINSGLASNSKQPNP